MKKLQVTAKHIKNGEPGSCDSCPIALAVQEQLGWSVADTVVSGSISKLFEDEGYHLPQKALDFIDRFDGGLKVEPFEFPLRPI